MVNSSEKIHQFIKAYVQAKNGTLSEHVKEVFAITLPDQSKATVYTYNPAVARDSEATLLTPGSPAFQQILKCCLENGVLSQISLSPKGNFEALISRYFHYSALACENCRKATIGEEKVRICEKPQLCFQQIKNGKIVSVRILKKEPTRYLQFYFAATFQNKLRPKNEELIKITLDENGKACNDTFIEQAIAHDECIEVQDVKSNFPISVFEKLEKVAYGSLDNLLEGKLLLFDLPLGRDKKAKLKAFERRLKRERRELVLSRKHDADPIEWQKNYEVLLRREEESFISSLTVRFINLLIVNTVKISFELTLDNNSIIRSLFVLGMNGAPDVSCQICKAPLTEGYATEDSLYVCHDCIRQSVETGKIYSKKAALRLDETLNEYFEHDSGFVCTVCGKRHCKLLEFKCSHDNSSICILHLGLCDVCKKPFSKSNLAHTEEFKRQLCPQHSIRCEVCQCIVGSDEVKRGKSGKKLCDNCFAKGGVP
jgi:hypothetical protein